MTDTRQLHPVPFDEDEPRAISEGEGSGRNRPQDQHLRNVYLRQPDPVGPGRRLGGLARRLGLEQYSPRLLTQKVALLLSAFAALLLATFAYELAAWSFFFNGIFVGDMTGLHWIGTTAAFLLALPFACAILFFEWQVITTDVFRLAKRKKLMAQAIRVTAILIAGFIVAHSVDLVAFSHPLTKKIHGDGVYAAALRWAADLDGMTANQEIERQSSLSNDLVDVRTAMEQARQRKDQAVGLQAGYGREVEFLQNHLGKSSESEIRDDETNHFSLQTAIGRQGAASATARSAERELADLSKKERALIEERAALEERTKQLRRTTERLKGRLRSWIGTLSLSSPGDRSEEWSDLSNIPEEEKSLWPENWRMPLKYKEPEKDFFEKIDMVYRLVFGLSNQSRKERTPLPRYLSSNGLHDEILRRTYFLSFLGIHLAAMFVPFLVFAVKWFLMPKEVDAYYSTWHQAFAGDPEARLMLAVEEKVRKQVERW